METGTPRTQHHRAMGNGLAALEILAFTRLPRPKKTSSVERRQHAQRRQRSPGIATAEEDVHIHQAVPDDGIGQRERHQHQRGHGKLLIIAGHRPQHIGQHVEQHERQHPGEGAVTQPLQLPPHDGVLGLAVFGAQRKPAHDVGKAGQQHPQAVQAPVQLKQREIHLERSGREGQVQQIQGGRHGV